MTYRCFEVDVTDKVASIKLVRPEKRNSMIPEFWTELPHIVNELDASAAARAIVISSTGPHFTAGLDLAAFMNANDPDSSDETTRRIRRGADFIEKVSAMQGTFTALEQCRVPVLAAIQGGCIGGGVDMVTACDMRYATEDAFFSIEEINVGMTADVGTYPRLVKLIPEGIVRELSYTGARLPAAEAKAYGLVNRVYPDQETMLADVMDIAATIAEKAPLAVYGCKRMITYSRDHNTADSLEHVGVWNASFLNPEEMMEAVQARAQKRIGKFVDLPKRKTGV